MYSFKEAVALFYKGFVQFDGRSTRSEYWWAILYQAIIWITFFIIVGVSSQGEFFEEIDNSEIGLFGGIATVLFILFALINILPNIALAVRRFHDLNQTGWLVLVFNILSNIPVAGLLIALGQLIWYAIPGTKGPNKYGPDPLDPHFSSVFD